MKINDLRRILGLSAVIISLLLMIKPELWNFINNATDRTLAIWALAYAICAHGLIILNGIKKDDKQVEEDSGEEVE